MRLDGETRRKLVHMAMVGFALALRPLPWWGAGLMAAAAVLYNLFAFRRLHGDGVLRAHERGARFARGLVYYPLSVLLLVLVYRADLVVVGAAWAVMALGDGSATLVGRAAGGPRLAWNPAKSWSGTAAFLSSGALGAFLVARFLAERTASGEPAGLDRIALGALLAALLGALVETLDLGVDDNLTVPAVAGAAFWVALHADFDALPADLGRRLLVGLAVNAAVGLLAWAAGGVDVFGWTAGVGVGTAVWSGAGPAGFLTLAAFFVLATAATKVGFRDKAARGLAEARGGRRSTGSVLAKGLVASGASIGALLVPEHRTAFLLALAGAFATAAADTVSSEIGKRFGRRAFLATTFRRVEPGTEGAISIEGTASGVLAGAAVAVTAAAAGVVTVAGAAAVTAAAAAANHLESVAGRLVRAEGERENEVLNFLNTLAGALLAVVLSRIVAGG